jgi:hypothetical protein
MMIYLVQSERSSRLRVENPSGISEEESFRFQPVLHSNEIVISLGQDHAADSERGDSNQRSLHNSGDSSAGWRSLIKQIDGINAFPLMLAKMQDFARNCAGQCLSAKYVNSKTHLRWKCGIGHEWTQ